MFHVEWAQNFGRRQAVHNSRLSVDVQHGLKLDYNLKADFDFCIHIQLNVINIFSRVDVVPLGVGGVGGFVWCQPIQHQLEMSC